MRKLLAAVTAAALITVLGACGTSGGNDDAGSDETTVPAEETTTTTEAAGLEVAEWADGFCGAFSGWLETIQTASGEVGANVTAGDLGSAQAAVADLFGTASAATTDLIGEVEALGAPDIEDGDQLVADLTGKFEGFVEAADTAQAETEALSLDIATFEADADALIATFQEEVQAIGDSFEQIDRDYPSPELQQALSTSCTF